MANVLESVLALVTRRTLALVSDEVLRQSRANWFELIASGAYTNLGPKEIFNRTIGQEAFDILPLSHMLPAEFETTLCIKATELLASGKTCNVYNLGEFQVSVEKGHTRIAFQSSPLLQLDRLPIPELQLDPIYAQAANIALIAADETYAQFNVSSTETLGLHECASELLSSGLGRIVERFAADPRLPLMLEGVPENYLDFQAFAIACATYHAYALAFWHILTAGRDLAIASIGHFTVSLGTVVFRPESALRKSVATNLKRSRSAKRIKVA
jgi:hypothetical protein